MQKPLLAASALLTISFTPNFLFGQVKNQLTTKPNIVLIVADDHGMNDLGCYGNKAIKTPNLDYLATQGIRMTDAYCTAPSSSPSRSVILTGLHNHANGTYGLSHNYHHSSSYEYIKGLPVFMSEAGYRTALAGKFHVTPEKVYQFETEIKVKENWNPVALADSCERFLKTGNDKPFFLYYCTTNPHRGGEYVDDNPNRPNRFGNNPKGYSGVVPTTFSPADVQVPYFLPDNQACREELAQYYQSVYTLDQGIGRLLKHLKSSGHWDNTIIIYISDNGIAFPGAKTTLYQPGVKLPCLIRIPDIKPNTTNNAMITWADLTPTILDYAGALDQSVAYYQARAKASPEVERTKTIGGFHGRSLRTTLESDESTGLDTVFLSHTYHEATMYYPMRAVVTRKYKLIWNIASGLEFPFASDLWDSGTWQYIIKQKLTTYGGRSVQAYINRPKFELYDLSTDPAELFNLASDGAYSGVLDEMKTKLKEYQYSTSDPWLLKWIHE